MSKLCVQNSRHFGCVQIAAFPILALIIELTTTALACSFASPLDLTEDISVVVLESGSGHWLFAFGGGFGAFFFVISVVARRIVLLKNDRTADMIAFHRATPNLVTLAVIAATISSIALLVTVVVSRDQSNFAHGLASSVFFGFFALYGALDAVAVRAVFPLKLVAFKAILILMLPVAVTFWKALDDGKWELLSIIIQAIHVSTLTYEFLLLARL